MKDQTEVVPENDDHQSRSRLRLPWLVLIVLLVIFSTYLNRMDHRYIAVNGQIIYSHPNLDYFGEGKLNLKWGQIVFWLLLLIAMSYATAVVCNWWWTGQYHIRTLLGQVLVISLLLACAVSFENDVISRSMIKSFLSLPMWFGASNLLMVIGHRVWRLVSSPRPNRSIRRNFNR